MGRTGGKAGPRKKRPVRAGKISNLPAPAAEVDGCVLGRYGVLVHAKAAMNGAAHQAAVAEGQNDPILDSLQESHRPNRTSAIIERASCSKVEKVLLEAQR
jgi:hypothetical protein